MKKVLVSILTVFCFSSTGLAFSMQSTVSDQSIDAIRLILAQNKPLNEIILAQREHDNPVPKPEIKQRKNSRAVEQRRPPQPARLRNNNEPSLFIRQKSGQKMNDIEQREQRMHQWEQALRERSEKLERFEHRIDALEKHDNEQRNYLQELAESLKHSVNQINQNHSLMMERRDDNNHEKDYLIELKEKLERQVVELEERRNQLAEQEHHIDSQHEELARKHEEICQESRMLDKQSQQINQQNEEIKRCQEELDKRNDQLRQREEELNQWSRNLEKRQRQLEEKEGEIDQRIAQSNEQLQREKDEIRGWSEDIERREQELNKRENHHDGLGPVGGIILLLLFLLWIWCLQDCLKRSTKDFPTDGRYDKIIWLITIICTLFIGAILYVFLVQGKSAKPE